MRRRMRSEPANWRRPCLRPFKYGYNIEGNPRNRVDRTGSAFRHSDAGPGCACACARAWFRVRTFNYIIYDGNMILTCFTDSCMGTCVLRVFVVADVWCVRACVCMCVCVSIYVYRHNLLYDAYESYTSACARVHACYCVCILCFSVQLLSFALPRINCVYGPLAKIWCDIFIDFFHTVNARSLCVCVWIDWMRFCGFNFLFNTRIRVGGLTLLCADLINWFVCDRVRTIMWAS